MSVPLLQRHPLTPSFRKLGQPVPPPPSAPLTTFDYDRTAELFGAARNSISTAELLLNFVHTNRNAARQAGVETVVIEMFAVMQGESFSGVVDAIEEAARSGHPLHLSQGGLATLRRIEGLTAEAMANMRKFADGDFTVMELAADRASLEADSQKAYLAMEERRLDMMRRELTLKEGNARRQQEAVASLKSSLGHSGESIQIAQASEPGKSESSSLSFLLPFAIISALVATVAVTVLVVKSQK